MVPPICISIFENLKKPHSTSLILFKSILHDLAVFSQISKTPSNYRGGHNFFWKTNSPEQLNYFVPLLIFIFKNLQDTNSTSTISFQYILHDLVAFFSNLKNFLKLKRVDLISWGESILQNDWIIWSSYLYLNFKTLKEPNSLAFVIFQYILHDSEVHLSV